MFRRGRGRCVRPIYTGPGAGSLVISAIEPRLRPQGQASRPVTVPIQCATSARSQHIITDAIEQVKIQVLGKDSEMP